MCIRDRRTVVRLAVCNLAILALYGIVLRFLGLDAEWKGVSVFLNAAMLVMGNAVFLMMDRCLAQLTKLWRRRLRQHFFKR